MDYAEFIAKKSIRVAPAGFEPPPLNPALFPFQRDIGAWALRKGRAAVFADCGLGKTPVQLEWARRVSEHTGGDVLVLAPLAVSRQTVREGEKFGVEVTACAEQSEVRPGVNVTNYEKLHRFDPGHFAGVVLDESSILKSFSGSTRNALIAAFGKTPHRLACTATPSPNDYMELGNHSEFLGVMTRSAMLATFFTHDGGETSKWRLKGHAEEAFWEWVCGWAVCLRRPSDLGYADDGFTLPPLSVKRNDVSLDLSDAHKCGTLFVKDAVTLSEQREARRGTLEKRVATCAGLVNSDPQPWVVWCELNDEGDALAKAIPGAVQVRGSDPDGHKERAMLDFAAGSVRVLVSKPSICGFGMNWQHCARVAFVGVSHSYEQTYQAIRRCWRFGQRNPVEAHFFYGENESLVLANMERKAAAAGRMAEGMLAHMRRGLTAGNGWDASYSTNFFMNVPEWMRVA